MALDANETSAQFTFKSMAFTIKGRAEATPSEVISRIDGSTFDLVEIPFNDVFRMIMWGTGSIENDGEVVLELFNPVTSERRSLPWTRYVREF